MEAASARAAARDRWNEFGRAPSQLQRFIQSACSPENYEPNLALNLEIADLVNSKKGSSPREASSTIVNFINHRNPNVALLALNLLDICVKNCGYPFHLQISTKEFLNELVRRFPERPPIRPTRVQTRILALIEEWRMTICDTSRYKEDLGFIRDMHRLLSYKGYVFPEVRSEDAAVLNPSENLKSPEEMEEEEKEAHSAKLQELIRRGSPEDLREANRLMKVMAGYDNRSKTDYRAKAAEEVGKIQAKARLLEERLEAFKPGDQMVDGDVFSELAAALSSAQPKIQKMCEEESDDHEAVAKLFDINDSIHRTVERYKLMKKGDLEGAAKVAAGGPTPSQAIGNAANELSLIDFDSEPAGGTNGGSSNGTAAAAPPSSSSTSTSQAQNTTGGLENDLLGLDLEPAPGNFGQGGSISLGLGPGPSQSASSGSNLLSSLNSSNNSATPPSGFQQSSSFSQFASFTSPSASHSVTPQQQPSPAPQNNFTAPPQPQAAKDPFASLGMSGIAASKPAAGGPGSAAQNNNNNNIVDDDDEWNFASALPPEASASTSKKPQEHQATISNTDVCIAFKANRLPSSAAVNLFFTFSNNTTQPVEDLHFQLAVTKGYELSLKPQSGRHLAPKQNAGISQQVQVFHAGNKSQKVDSVRLRWRVAYKSSGGQMRNELGDVPEFEIA